MLLSRIFLCLVLIAPVEAVYGQHSAARFSHRIAILTAKSPAIQRGRVGYKFVDLETGDVLAQEQPSSFFTPASNTKLYTTALALVRLGANYTFHTELRTTTVWSPGQTLVKDLQLIGGGDPNLSGRLLPYAVNSNDADPLTGLERLADKLVNAGIRTVDGDVVGVSTRYPGDLYPNGWTIEDSVFSYGAPVTALTPNDNTISLSLLPTDVGELADVEVRPVISHFVVLNEVLTDASKATHIHISRQPGSSEVVVSGTIGQTASAWHQDLAMDDPALFAAEALIDVLRDRGIVVRGVARSEYRSLNNVASALQANQMPRPGTTLAIQESPPLWEAIQVTNKISQNLHAEMLLREVAQVARGVGTLEAGLAEREAFLQEIGITRDAAGFMFADGSGLARQDLTTPDSTVALLSYMWRRPDREVWLQSLPIGGVDGSLEHRFHNIRGAERIHAKTGSISHVNALSGYIETKRHRWLVFSIMVNATVGHDAEVRDFIDHLCAMFLEG